jgi:hypothetical protein
MWFELLLLAVASAFWPLLLAVDVIALHAPHPARLLACFLAGGLLTCVVIGTLIAQALRQTSLATGPRPTADPVVYLGAGVLALVVALLLGRRSRVSGRKKKDTGPSLYERALQRGAPLAFLVGVVLNVVPGLFPFVALKDVAQLDYGVAATAALLTVFYVVMFAFVEVPLVAFLVAPDRTTAMTADFNRWLSAHGRRIAVVVLWVVGAYLIVRGSIALL